MRFKILVILLICIFAGYYLGESNKQRVSDEFPVVERPMLEEEESAVGAAVKDMENLPYHFWIEGYIEITGTRVYSIDDFSGYYGELTIFANGMIFHNKNNIDPHKKYVVHIKKLYRKVDRYWRRFDK
jgi:hypothetical protein